MFQRFLPQSTRPSSRENSKTNSTLAHLAHRRQQRPEAEGSEEAASGQGGRGQSSSGEGEEGTGEGGEGATEEAGFANRRWRFWFTSMMGGEGLILVRWGVCFLFFAGMLFPSKALFGLVASGFPVFLHSWFCWGGVALFLECFLLVMQPLWDGFSHQPGTFCLRRTVADVPPPAAPGPGESLAV